MRIWHFSHPDHRAASGFVNRLLREQPLKHSLANSPGSDSLTAPMVDRRLLSLSLLVIATSWAPWRDLPAEESVPTASPVGMSSQIRDLVLPGSELIAKPLQPGAPLVVRVLATRPHGDSFRYDFDYYGLEEGEFDLGDFLQRADGSAADDIPAIPLRFEAVLASDRITPNDPQPSSLPRVGGYTLTLIIAAIVWFAVLLLLLFAGRKKGALGVGDEARPPTFAERLRPLVEAARDGSLDGDGQAELERTLLSFWREELDLRDESPATAMAKLRQNEVAAPLLEQLERWLHQPNPESPADLDALLAPYARSGAPSP